MDKELIELNNRIRKLIFNKAGISPHETFSNSNTITTTSKELLWRPNNYRRDLSIQPNFYLNLYTTEYIKGTIESTHKEQKVNISYNNHTKVYTIKDFYGVIIQIAKHKMTAILPQIIIEGEKQYYKLEGNLNDITTWLNKEKEKMRELLDSCLFKISELFNLTVPCATPKWQRYEDFLKGDEFLDSIPAHTIIHADIGKKVYDTGWEFHKKEKEEPTANMLNYIKERALEKNYEPIHDSIGEIKSILTELAGHNRDTSERVKELAEGTSELAFNMRTHVAIMKQIEIGLKEMGMGLNKFNQLLDRPRERSKLIVARIKSELKSLDELKDYTSLINDIDKDGINELELWLFERFST